jgi:hypothetical protein
MKERPILFSAAMVRAILEGRKTVTRRVVKLPHQNPLGQWEPTTFGGTDAHGVEHDEQAAIWHTRTGDTLACPYGQPGDRLWVRETWQYFGFSDEGEPCICYLADHGREWPHVPQSEADKVDCIWADLSDPENFSISDRACDNRWRPSIHMPRWASRITLEVTGVRVERLWEITPEQAIAEGIEGTRPSNQCEMAWRDYAMAKLDPFEWFGRPVDSFHSLWVSINGTDSWNANPWVWVVEFQRIQQAYAEATAA